MSLANFLLLFLHVVQIISLYVAIRCWKKNKGSNQHFFLHFIIFAISIELVAFCIKMVFEINNSFVFNIYIIISFIFFFTWFKKILNLKLIFNIILVLYVFIAVFSILTEDFMKSMLDICFYSGAIGIIIFAFKFYAKLLKSDKAENFLKFQEFWIVTGLFIFHIGFLPIFLLQDLPEYSSLSNRIALLFLNITLYGSYIKGLSCPMKV